MGSGSSNAARLCPPVDTGVLRDCLCMAGPQGQRNKEGAGGAALAKLPGDTLYVLGNKGLAVFDVSVPANLGPAAKVAQIDPGAIEHSSGAAMAFSGDTMYVAGGLGLAVFDVSNPRAPAKVGDTIETGALSAGGAAALVVDGDRLYLAGGKGLKAFDIGDPRAPRPTCDLIDTKAIGHPAQCSLALNGSALYVAGGGGLRAVSLANRDQPEPQGKEGWMSGPCVDTGALGWDGGAATAIVGTKLFVAGGNGLATVDISKPLEPKKVTCVDTGVFSYQGGCAIAVGGGKMFLGGGKGLGIYELSDPPVKKASMETGVFTIEAPTAVLQDGDVLYCAGGHGLIALDLKLLTPEAGEVSKKGAGDIRAQASGAEGDALRMFKEWDTDGNGTISVSELKAIFAGMGAAYSDRDIEIMLKLADTDNDGQISYEEFLAWAFK